MMLKLLEERMPVVVYDRAGSGMHKVAAQVRQLSKPLRFMGSCACRRNAGLYLALSGGYGQFIDLIYVIVSRMFQVPIFVHHHSFAYIDAPTSLSRLVFALLRRETHVVLGEKMGRQLAKMYRIDERRIKVVSNAAFYASLQEVPANRDNSTAVSIGFLSNITFDKGFVEFFEILTRLRLLGIPYRAQIAGPLAHGATAVFDRLLREAGDVEYVGPVYDEAKDRFYDNLDIFVFPTKYSNEAEPLVLFEAMRRGVFVIACDRGSIGEMLENGAGAVFGQSTVVESAAKQIREFAMNRPSLAAAQSNAVLQAQRIRSAGKVALDELLIRIQGRLCKESRTGMV